MKNVTGFVCLLVAGALTASASSDRTAEDWKQLRSEKRRIATVANELSVLARANHLTSWETHTIAMIELRQLVNSSGQRIVRLQSSGVSPAQLEEIRKNLAAVAMQLTSLKQAVNENRLATRMPAYYDGVMKLVQNAEESRKVADRVVSAALSGTATTTTAD